jgi:hypothetical protein
VYGVRRCPEWEPNTRHDYHRAEEGERPLLEAATKQRLVKTWEDFMCVVFTVIYTCVTRSVVVVCMSSKSDYQSKPHLQSLNHVPISCTWGGVPKYPGWIRVVQGNIAAHSLGTTAGGNALAWLRGVMMTSQSQSLLSHMQYAVPGAGRCWRRKMELRHEHGARINSLQLSLLLDYSRLSEGDAEGPLIKTAQRSL